MVGERIFVLKMDFSRYSELVESDLGFCLLKT